MEVTTAPVVRAAQPGMPLQAGARPPGARRLPLALHPPACRPAVLPAHQAVIGGIDIRRAGATVLADKNRILDVGEVVAGVAGGARGLGVERNRI